ncbi:hypothetical protein [Ralstonia solanacearum]|uniref:hypothetical protein n=1 Tax=Ralstonia solanacearum TaxID=305 RepID=UPI0013011AF1|nr:hypothetical protein [Ralstonia solanacearum]
MEHKTAEARFLWALGAQGDPLLLGGARRLEGQAEVEDAVARFGKVRRQVQGGEPLKAGHLSREPKKKALEKSRAYRILAERGGFEPPIGY